MTKIFKCVRLFIFLNHVLVAFTAQASSPVGQWTTIDDKTGVKRASVDISIHNHVLQGVIRKVYAQAGDRGICSKCPDQFKNKAIEGLTFLWGLRETSPHVWDGGYILDPKNGKIYRAKLRLKHHKLYVRGYVGIAMLGRTQIWVRDND